MVRRFEGMSLIDRSRAVHETLAEEIKVRIENEDDIKNPKFHILLTYLLLADDPPCR